MDKDVHYNFLLTPKTILLQAFKKHALHDPLKSPGTADLTADVDFRHIKDVAERHNQTVCYGPVEQGTFLNRMEGELRLEVLKFPNSNKYFFSHKIFFFFQNLIKAALPDNRADIKSAYEMLTHPEQMGSRFKFFSLFPAILKEHLKKYPVDGFN